MAVLGVIRDEGLQGNAAHVGGHLLRVLRGLQAQHALVGDVRGVGLMLGVELVTDPASKTHAPAVSCSLAVWSRAAVSGRPRLPFLGCCRSHSPTRPLADAPAR